MPSLAGLIHPVRLEHAMQSLVKRIGVTVTPFSDPGLIAASKEDPWNKSGKYAASWIYFSIILLVATAAIRLYHLWTDKMRRALYKEEIVIASKTSSPDTDYEMMNLGTSNSTAKFFPRSGALPMPPKEDPTIASIGPINNAIAMLRWFFYRPIPIIRWRKREFSFPSLGVTVIVSAATIFVVLYCFLPKPLFYATIAYGSPPLAIRAGMIAVAMIPWIVALSMKANFISMITGIGHERLNVLHRWAGYICLLLALIHTIPFYITPVWDQGGLQTFKTYFKGQVYIYGTGIAALAPLGFLCIHSLPFLRSWMYELFVICHVPVSIVFIGMMFWHCHNYLTSWDYLWATVAVWVLSYIVRLFYLNWTNPRRTSWLIGEEAAVTILPENAVKVTVPTQMKWRPGQYVYLRMPGISIFENHPFTIASLCSNDFPSEYGEQYRDMILVFRPFSGFTRKVVNAATTNGPYHTYRAFLDGPYGGMQRELASFDTVVLFAGGSGITAIVSQLLDLIKRMRDGRAVTKQVHVVWALKRPETMEWFKEELRICRQYAPPESVHCQFFITGAKRHKPGQSLAEVNTPRTPHTPGQRASQILHDRINDAFQGIATKRNSALIREAAGGDLEKEREYRQETEDEIAALPQAYVGDYKQPIRSLPTSPDPSAQQQWQPYYHPYQYQNTPLPAPQLHFPPPPKVATKDGEKAPTSTPITRRPKPTFKLQIPAPSQPLPARTNDGSDGEGFDFGFPSTPTVFQKNLMRFAFLPSMAPKKSGWTTEYGRPDIPYMLRGFARDFGGRTCVFVCGPSGMRVDVQREVARLQSEVFAGARGGRREVEEIFLHTENYAI
ncbi:hypothetical protein MMC25_002233 [Agyrium rufum]|nr:hypothetical protein [Agyrium rufum]